MHHRHSRCGAGPAGHGDCGGTERGVAHAVRLSGNSHGSAARRSGPEGLALPGAPHSPAPGREVEAIFHAGTLRYGGLGRVAVQRSWFPVPRSPDSAGQGSGQCQGRLLGTTHGELDFLIDFAGQTPGLILRPHQVRLLRDARCRPVPSQSWCVSERFDGAGEQQHRPIRNLHSRRVRRQRPARPALPDCRIPRGRRGRV